ncbi:MAG: type I methionyl aminopeptidase [Nitrospirales bacterium]|nr:type I methionyl aminopeptidase [Nitrospirales bacterium]
MIILKSEAEINKIRTAGRVVGEILGSVKTFLSAGMTTAEIEQFIEDRIRDKKAVPAFKGYRRYPACSCISINNQVVHGIPSKTVMVKDGDIVSIDLGVIIDGYYGDAAVTIPVGPIRATAADLLRVTEESLHRGIQKATIGNRLSDISAAIQQHVESHGFSVVRAFVGHGIGRMLHEDPQVPNFGRPGAGPRLKEGMTLAIEPMVNAGRPDVMVLDDGWTAVTTDGSLSAHFEHTIAITKNGPQILTKP